MRYIERDAGGAIAATYANDQGGRLIEALPDDHPELLAFRGEDLAGRKADAMARVDAGAEAARARWITPGAGQALAYEAKRREAERWAADPAPDPASYPWARDRAARLAGIGPAQVTVVQAQAVIDEWSAKAAAWAAAGIEIERVREAAKEAVAAAPDLAAINAALAGLSWPAPV